jgi:CheY-like chemotaxis protein
MSLDCTEAELRKALASLHDPDFAPSELLRSLTGCRDANGAQCVRDAIRQALESLKPTPDMPPSARARRIYDVLSCRYILALTQEATAERLGITARHLRREQREAVLVLARHLLERQEHRSLAAGPARDDPTGLPALREQVRQELAALEQSAPDSVADVAEALQAAVALEKTRTARLGVTVTVADARQRLIVAAHPSMLRQVFVMALGLVAAESAGGAITIQAQREGEHAAITLRGQPVAHSAAPDTCLLDEMLAAQDGTLELTHAGDTLSVRIVLPAADEITVLVVDDNQDLVHFYRRYTADTRYRIVHIPTGKGALAAIEASAPGIIVLDVMLPDIDGWELLAHLYDHPATRAIPIVVCSVIREEELALELGAAVYVPKPVRRGDLLAALDRALAAAGHPSTSYRDKIDRSSLL